MPKTKTWIWIIVGFIGFCFLCLVGVAGGAVYFVRQHIKVDTTKTADPLQAFDVERKRFKDQAPLLQMDSMGRPRPTRPFADIPTSATKPTDLRVMVWDPDHERLVNVSLPFWIVRLGGQKVHFMSNDQGFDMDRLNLNAADLERIGPTLVLDYRSASGERVLVWTQ